MFSFEHRVIDNDADGSLGGTWYRLTVERFGEVVAKYSYGPQDIQSGQLASTLAKYKDTNRVLVQEAKARAEHNAEVEKANRIAKIVIPPRTKALAMDTIDANTMEAASYIAGNTKALNSLVGKTIALAKKTNETVDPVAVKTVLEQLLTVKE